MAPSQRIEYGFSSPTALVDMGTANCRHGPFNGDSDVRGATDRHNICMCSISRSDYSHKSRLIVYLAILLLQVICSLNTSFQ